MKEKLYTIPLNDAINAEDECPFCYVERALEQDTLDLVLGSCASYMESDMREITDKEGFCREHFKKMYDYGNVLGNSWILKTHYMKMRKDMQEQMKKYKPEKVGLAAKIMKKNSVEKTNSVAAWVAEREKSCYICNHNREIYERYIDTFFIVYNKDEEFREKIRRSKGFCLTHFGDLCEAAETKMNLKQKEEFFAVLFPLMEKNMARMQEDIDWRVEKFDYRYNDADWKNSKDAVQRGMQNLKGGYPADQPYRMPK